MARSTVDHQDAPVPTAAAAVVRSARAQLAALDANDPTTTHRLALLLAATEDLLERAGFEDAVAARCRHRQPEAEDGLSAALDGRAGPEAVRRAVALLRPAEIGPLPVTVRLDVPDPGGAAPTTAADIAAYLRSRGDVREVVETTIVTGGFSKETVLLRLRGPEGDEEIALRKVAKGRVADTLADEFAVLGFAAEHGVAVAEPLWLDTDGHPLDGPLFATRRVQGRTVGNVTGAAEGADAATARQLATQLARLHTAPLTGDVRAPRPPMATTDDLETAIEQRERIVEQAAATLPDTPALRLHRVVLRWLRANMPAPGGPTVLVHGDVGFHNVLVENGRLTALLDWELAHQGRPAEDLAYVRPSVETLLPWAEFVDRYRSAGGSPVDEAELHFFTVWQDVWRATSCLRLRTAFLVDPARLNDGVSGLLLRPRFLDSALRTAFGEDT